MLIEQLFYLLYGCTNKTWSFFGCPQTKFGWEHHHAIEGAIPLWDTPPANLDTSTIRLRDIVKCLCSILCTRTIVILPSLRCKCPTVKRTDHIGSGCAIHDPLLLAFITVKG